MLPHTLITASAGSGKTWRLTVRYLRLVLMGAEPETIVALTFSRKAAGEFFNAILHRLAEAAAHTTKAEALARDIEMPEKTVDDFGAALVKLTSRLPFLMLGTLDSFFIRLARSFPFELGLSGEFTLLDEHQQSVEKLRVYERVFAPDDSTAEARAEFRRAFTEATFGKDEIRVRALLDGFVDSWHYQYLSTPDPECWGNPRRIWPDGAPVPGPQLDRAEVIARIRRALPALGLTGKHQERWEGFLTTAAGHLPGSPIAAPMAYLWAKLVPLLKPLSHGQADLKLDRKEYSLTGPLAEALSDLLRHLIAGELAAVLRQTRGIFEVVRRYDAAWHALVRRQGRLTFHDVQLILGGGLNPEASGHEAQAARFLTHQENRQLMDYRLDARYDHWLLDEFQDTSRVQWKVLSNLMDEAIQDSGGRKSFFAVGDRKQSIYEWRGGTPALFDELQAQYNLTDLPPDQRPLKVEPLALSQRSGPAVISMVNELLGDAEKLRGVLPEAAVARWKWQHHESKNIHYGGAAMVVEVDMKTDAGNEDADDGFADTSPAWKRAAELISELKPLKRGLTCAVICHRNDRALALTNFLRAATGMPTVCESDLSIALDNPATSALLAVLQFAAHPGDEFAWQHVMMTPLADVVMDLPADAGYETTPPNRKWRRPLASRVLTQIAESGFHGTLRWWAEALAAQQRRRFTDLDAFSLSRMDELCGCAREFDRTGSRGTDEFLAYAKSWTERGASHDGAIQVMTVHRSKGLTFDVVVIPDMGYPHTFINRFTMGKSVDDRGVVRWLTKLPNKDISESDPVLSAALERAVGDQWCERLAGIYVMVTRAKFANYIFLPAPASREKTSSTPTLPAIVRGTLQQPDAGELKIGIASYPLIAEFGDPDWISDHPLRGNPTAAAAAPVLRSPGSQPSAPAVQLDLFGQPSSAEKTERPGKKSLSGRTHPLKLRRPSETTPAAGVPFFQTAREAARVAGIAIHALLQKVEWVSGPETFPVARADDESMAEVHACLAAPALRGFFMRPAGPVTLWRERAFDVVMDGVHVSGIFDRVMVRNDSSGKPQSAVLIDFKTEIMRNGTSPREAARGHQIQMNLYREALARLLALPEDKIRAVVMFTAHREAVDL